MLIKRSRTCLFCMRIERLVRCSELFSVRSPLCVGIEHFYLEKNDIFCDVNRKKRDVIIRVLKGAAKQMLDQYIETHVRRKFTGMVY